MNYMKDVSPSKCPSLCLTHPIKHIQKGWGRKSDNVGEVFVYHQPQELDKALNVETVKLLHLAKGKQLSIHFHCEKREYFYMVRGSLDVLLWEEFDNCVKIKLEQGQRMMIPPGMRHRMIGVEEENILLEVSTLDKDEDSYRIEKGD